MKNIVACMAIAASLSSMPPAAFGQGAESYPDKPIQIVVPFAPGGGSDTLARAVGQKLGERWKQPVIVVNKPGADGNIGAQFVAAAPKDGYTLMVLDVGTLTIGPVFYKTFSELREYARANPDKLNFANHNNSAALAGYKLSADTGVKMTQIPYKGAGAAMTGLIGGEVNVTLVSLFLATPQINSGTLRAIAVASPKRMGSAPAIPTLIESGVPDYVMGSWQGVLAPAGTPAPIVRKLQLAIAEILKDPAMRQRLEGQGAEVIANTPEEFGALLGSQARSFLAVGRQSNVKPQ